MGGGLQPPPPGTATTTAASKTVSRSAEVSSGAISLSGGSHSVRSSAKIPSKNLKSFPLITDGIHGNLWTPPTVDGDVRTPEDGFHGDLSLHEISADRSTSPLHSDVFGDTLTPPPSGCIHGDGLTPPQSLDPLDVATSELMQSTGCQVTVNQSIT